MFLGVSQHAEFDFDVRFARGDAHMFHPENTPEFNLKVALSPPGVLLVSIYEILAPLEKCAQALLRAHGQILNT